jgi:hypothetical protein
MPLYNTTEVMPDAGNPILTSPVIGESVSQLLPANPERKVLLIENNTTESIYIGFDSNTSISRYSFVLVKGYWEMPQPIFKGAIFGVIAPGGESSTVSPNITEFS